MLTVNSEKETKYLSTWWFKIDYCHEISWNNRECLPLHCTGIEKFLLFFERFGKFEGSSFIGWNPYRKELGGASGVTARVSTWLWTWETSGTFWNVREPGRTRRRNVLVADAIKARACPYSASSLQDKQTLKKRLPSQESSHLPTVFHSYSIIHPRYCNLNIFISSP